jgi:hypothetical protein
LTRSEKVLVSFFALFAALFSIKVLSGFFLSCFLLFLPLLIAITPYNWFWTQRKNNALFITCSGFLDHSWIQPSLYKGGTSNAAWSNTRPRGRCPRLITLSP